VSRAAVRHALTALALLAALAALAACGPSAGELRIEDPWIRDAPDGATALAGYMTVDWTGREPLRLVAARSPHFGRIEMHQSRDDDGRARMQQLETVPILPGGTTRFEPGGLHLMLLSPDGAIRAGDRVPIELEFDDGRRVQAQFRIRDARPQG